MGNDSLITIDLKTFDKGISNCINQLSKFEEKVDKAISGLTYLAGNIIVKEAKRNHSFKSRTGTLVRSLHCAPAGANHTNDAKLVGGSEVKVSKEIGFQGWMYNAGSDLIDSKGTESRIINGEIRFELGSWLNYAYYVERGTKYMTAKPYLLPAFESKFEDVVNYVIEGLQKIISKAEK